MNWLPGLAGRGHRLLVVDRPEPVADHLVGDRVEPPAGRPARRSASPRPPATLDERSTPRPSTSAANPGGSRTRVAVALDDRGPLDPVARPEPFAVVDARVGGSRARRSTPRRSPVLWPRPAPVAAASRREARATEVGTVAVEAEGGDLDARRPGRRSPRRRSARSARVKHRDRAAPSPAASSGRRRGRRSRSRAPGRGSASAGCAGSGRRRQVLAVARELRLRRPLRARRRRLRIACEVLLAERRRRSAGRARTSGRDRR